jgi:hypothetical protein
MVASNDRITQGLGFGLALGAATRFSYLFLALLAQWRLSAGCNVFREPIGSAVAIRALPDLLLWDSIGGV